MQRAMKREGRERGGGERDEADRYRSSRVGVISTSSSTAANAGSIGGLWVVERRRTQTSVRLGWNIFSNL